MIKNNQNGFTLIEVMISLAIFSIGILSIMLLQTTGIKGNATANTVTAATIHATNQLEQIYAMDYDDLLDTSGDGAAGLDDIVGSDGTATGTSPEGSYSIFWNVWEEAPMPMTKTVRVIVQRLERGATRTIVFNYIRAEIVDI